jgi:hypothetical protein
MTPRRVGCALCLLLIFLPAQAFAQATVRVTTDRASIWQLRFLSVIGVVEAGRVLEVVGRQGDWLEVVVPAGSSEPRRTGLIAITQVSLATGTLPADGTSTSPPLPPTAGLLAEPAAGQPLDSGFRVFGDASYHWFTANESIRAVIGRPGSPFVGGGAEFRLSNGAFVQGAARWFQDTGERVFVLDDEVFALGIRDTITIVPISATVGYRFRAPGGIPYVGAGVGVHLFKETSDFADPAENTDERFASYHFLAGSEFRARAWLGVAFEAQFTLVPDSLDGALAEIYDEHDLGGFELRVKVVLGR